MTFEPGTPPADAAPTTTPSPPGWPTVAGERLLEVRGEGLEGRELKDAGDGAAHELLMRAARRAPPRRRGALRGGRATTRPGSTPTGSGSSTRSTAPASSPSRRATTGPSTSRCGQDGDLVAGAVAQPALGETFNTGAPPVVPPRTSDRPRIAVSRTRPPAFVEALAEELDAELVPMGSAGVKVMSVVRDVADAYVHAGGQYEWDNAAPVAVARAAGLFCSRVDGSELVYNQDDVSLPDLIVCRPELADAIVDFVKRHGTD